MLAMLEPPVRAERTEERLLKGVLGAFRTQPAAEEPEHLVPVLDVEVLERWDRHGVHHLRETHPGADL